MSEQAPQENNYNYNAYTGGQSAPAPVASPERPKQVNISFWLLIACLVLSVLTVPLGIAGLNSAEGRETLENQLQQQNPGNLTVDDVISASTAFLVIVAVLNVAVTLLVAFFIRKGHNWARILLTVFTVLSLLALVVPGGLTPLGIAGMVLLLAATVLLYITPAPEFFKAMKQYRISRKFGQAY
ncbi:hypothetical protein OL239_17420 [Arthrobacter sp. ATA002]|uniref:hypothetical protein n=1 Tax=Arthrobacter sp. ATA002 TaxID=2991715 RepID=UPI0022A70878|nr:hypothetical protein [Arthrobacter sp. ATA002]WAP51542.1 hypothetical protein OL239_17420 [Arthrobacter sp. ATA002]